MAKNKKTAPTVTENDERIFIGNGDFTIPLSDLIADKLPALAYLANYGLNKSLQDAVAGRKGELRAALNGENDQGLDPDARKYSDEEVAVILHDEMKARFDAILSGTVGTRGPGKPRASKLESVMSTVATERMKAAAAKAGKSLPKGEALVELRTKYIAKFEAEIRAEAERRMADAASGADELADLL